VRERGHGARLPHEALAQLGLCRQRWRQDLDRHRPLEMMIARQHHHAHAAATELALDHVAAGERALEGRQLATRLVLAGCVRGDRPERGDLVVRHSIPRERANPARDTLACLR
jgi:hypothetical protein